MSQFSFLKTDEEDGADDENSVDAHNIKSALPGERGVSEVLGLHTITEAQENHSDA